MKRSFTLTPHNDPQIAPERLKLMALPIIPFPDAETSPPRWTTQTE